MPMFAAFLLLPVLRARKKAVKAIEAEEFHERYKRKVQVYCIYFWLFPYVNISIDCTKRGEARRRKTFQ